MPEFVEAEAYRRTAEPLVGQRIDGLEIRDERLLRQGDATTSVVGGVLGGATIAAVRRIGKAVLIDTDSGHTAALAFGLRGWLSLDGQLARASGGWRTRMPTEEHLRLVIHSGERQLELEDQLRLSTLRIDIDEARFGIDILELTPSDFRDICAASGRQIKSLLMDQDRIAGIGNLIADEIFFQGKIDPRRPANELDKSELEDLWVGVRRTRQRVLDRNGSHQTMLIQSGAREKGAECPRCKVEISRIEVGGRTTYFCPEHQR